jgi:hypothetical protein
MSTAFSVTVVDTVGGFSAYLEPIRDSTLVAASNWLSAVVGLGSLEIEVTIAETASNTANGSAGAFRFASSQQLDGRSVSRFDPVTLTEILTGVDRNDTAADIVITLDPDRLNQAFGSYWFDPNPFDADHEVPKHLSDGLGVMMHEIGHGLGIDGFRDDRTGAFSNIVSPFDTFVVFVNGDPFFDGPNAVSEFGGLVPLTPGNLRHYGTVASGGGLLDGIMNGVVTPVGTERQLSRLDFAILEDLGFQTVDSIEVSVTAHIEQLSGGTITQPPVSLQQPVSLSAGTGPDTLVLRMSEDAWQGDAQYTVKVNDTQIDATFTAKALHSAGQSDILTLHGTWGTGVHTVTIDFLNDAYGGTAATDRNLYVDNITYNGVSHPELAHAMNGGGAQDYVFG